MKIPLISHAILGLAVLAGAVSAPAQQAASSPEAYRERHERATVKPLAGAVRTGAVSAAVATAKADSKTAFGASALVRAVSIETGQARVTLADGVERSIKAGDTVAGDVVKEIGGGKIVLMRTDPERGESLVIATLDAKGRTSVMVVSKYDGVSSGTTRRPAPVK